MFILVLISSYVCFIILVTAVSYRLGISKTENAIIAGMVGFVVSFLPPLAMIYLGILVFKEESGIV